MMTKGELTRQKIIEAAAPIFNQRGYAGCSMQDVLDATGLEKGGLYRHFSNKEELAAEAFRYASAQAIELRTRGLDDIPNAVEKLRCFVERFVTVASPVKGGCPLMNTAIDADDGNPQLRELARKAIESWKLRIVKVVRDGMRRGEIRKDVDARRFANTVFAILEGSLMISRIEGAKNALAKNALKDAQITLEGMLKEISA
jgi:TetR/AcrR family transcriptional repressor of nem operon